MHSLGEVIFRTTVSVPVVDEGMCLLGSFSFGTLGVPPQGTVVVIRWMSQLQPAERKRIRELVTASHA